MGLVIRSNIQALNANNSLQKASKAQAKGMEKLASGYRINKAADDASGMSMVEKMKNQITSIDTAKANCEDGANMIQTAEGYMSETHDILNRMTELAEKAANGVLGDEDRSALQDEMDQLCGEVDRIATTANFNGHKLLDGSLGSKEAVKLISDRATGTIRFSSPEKGSISGGGVIDVKGAVASGSLKVGVSYSITADKVELKSGSGSIQLKGRTTSNATPTIVSVSLMIKDGDKVSIHKGQTAASTADGLSFTAAYAADDDLLLTYNQKDNAWYDQNGREMKVSSVEAKVGGNYKLNEGVNLQIGDSSTTADRLSVNINSFHTDTLFGGLNGFKNETADSTDYATTAEVKINNGNAASTYKNAVTIDISDKDHASAAADSIRQISNYVSAERANLGATQNRLEYTVDSLTTSSENTTAAKSRISDTDMAKEMMAYTAKNVATQAAQTMLAQANSQPQSTLSLLQ